MRRMRGEHREPDSIFSYVSPEHRIPKDHPLRAIRTLVDDVLGDMSREFDRLYATTGRPSIPPERLLRAQLLQIFYSIRSELLLMEQLNYNLLFRWFVGLTMDDPVWDATTFTKNRDRLLNQEIVRSFFGRVVERAQGLMSNEHFTVDGTLIEAWASQKSFQRKDRKTDGDAKNFRGQTRANDTHASTTDPDAKLYRKSNGAESRLAYLGPLLIENRHGQSWMRWRRRPMGERNAMPVCCCCTRSGNARRGDGGRSARTKPTMCRNSSTSRASWAAPHMSRRI
jgi:transposase